MNRQQVGIQKNFEWKTFDYYMVLQNDLDDVTLKFSSYFGLGWEKYYLYTIAVLMSHYQSTDNDVFGAKIQYTCDRLKNLTSPDQYINELIDKNYMYFPAIKCHSEHPKLEILLEDSIPWGNKLNLIFPPGKEWVQVLMLLWKHDFHNYNNSSFKGEFLNSFISRIKSNEKTKLDYLTAKNIPSDCKTIDMYKLIFEKDVNQISSAIENFEITEDRLKLLDLAHTTSIKIINELGFDHTHLLTEAVTITEFIKDTKLESMIREFK
jgi:hypothetical protein